jgi:hypothetical protein
MLSSLFNHMFLHPSASPKQTYPAPEVKRNCWPLTSTFSISCNKRFYAYSSGLQVPDGTVFDLPASVCGVCACVWCVCVCVCVYLQVSDPEEFFI